MCFARPAGGFFKYRDYKISKYLELRACRNDKELEVIITGSKAVAMVISTVQEWLAVLLEGHFFLVAVDT